MARDPDYRPAELDEVAVVLCGGLGAKTGNPAAPGAGTVSDGARGLRECWHAADLAGLAAQAEAGRLKAAEPSILLRSDGRPLLYAGMDHAISGESEAGKTWVALVAAIEVARSGRRVTWVDYEDTPETFVLRWQALGGPLGLIASAVHYVVPTGDPATWPALVAGADLVVIDTVNESVTTGGGDPVKMPDMNAWQRAIVAPALAAGAATLMLDHLPKPQHGNSSPPRYSYGSVTKLNALRGAAYTLTIVRPFDRKHDGVARLTVAKDRPGAVRAAAEAGVAAEVKFINNEEGIAVTLDPPRPKITSGAGNDQRAVYMERISRWGEEQQAHWSKAAAERGVRGTPRHVGPAVDALKQEGYLTTEIGQGGHTVYAVVKPYRDAA